MPMTHRSESAPRFPASLSRISCLDCPTAFRDSFPSGWIVHPLGRVANGEVSIAGMADPASWRENVLERGYPIALAHRFSIRDVQPEIFVDLVTVRLFQDMRRIGHFRQGLGVEVFSAK